MFDVPPNETALRGQEARAQKGKGIAIPRPLREVRRKRPKLIQVKARNHFSAHADRMWNPIASAPFGRSLELAVLDEDGLHALVFPCEKGREGWRDAVTGVRVDIRPTHWREWDPQKDKTASLRNLP
ncbi:hypothetical protein [Mesorhizobium sp. WSM4904]|uniref:hypothetical protein n=1 Tax=Mesorhizobium sp. WSM4904 TaxID=3038545 RepID=UPI00325B1E58